MAEKKKIELIKGVIPDGPVDETKVVQCEPAEPMVEAYGMPINPWQGFSLLCPKCGATSTCKSDPRISRMYRCYKCGFVYSAGGSR